MNKELNESNFFTTGTPLSLGFSEKEIKEKRRLLYPLYVSSEELTLLHSLAYEAQQEDHLEVCGAILVNKDSRISFKFLENQIKDSYHYEIDIDQILKLENFLLINSLVVFGSFHSHPISDPDPGEGDIEKGFLNGIEGIYDVCGEELKIWELDRTNPRAILAKVPYIAKD